MAQRYYATDICMDIMGVTMAIPIDIKMDSQRELRMVLLMGTPMGIPRATTMDILMNWTRVSMLHQSLRTHTWMIKQSERFMVLSHSNSLFTGQYLRRMMSLPVVLPGLVAESQQPTRFAAFIVMPINQSRRWLNDILGRLFQL
jgi:hypothetical protein